MGFRFFRRVKILPGVSINLSKSGASVSVGPRGAKVTVGPRGTRGTVSLPGTGMSYSETLSTPGRSRAKAAAPRTAARTSKATAAAAAVPAPETAASLNPGFFARLVLSAEETAFVEGCRCWVEGDQVAAARALAGGAEQLADAALLLGYLHLQARDWAGAARALLQARARAADLGRLFHKYGIAAELALPVAPTLTAMVSPGEAAVLLGLVEAYQGQGDWRSAADCLQALQAMAPDDPLLRLSLAELYLEANPADAATARYVLSLSEGQTPADPITRGLWLYRAKAMRVLGLYAAAEETLGQLGRNLARSEPELDLARRHELACLLEAQGQTAKARLEWQRLYAREPNYPDAAQRLGL